VAKKKLDAKHEKTLTDMGIDWKSIDWAKIVQTILALLGLFQTKMEAAAKGENGEECPDCDCIKKHFEMISKVAECGIACVEAMEASEDK
jgi:hypothetical protein